MNIDNVNIDGNTIDVDTGDLILKSDTGQVQMTALQNMNITGTQGATNITSNQNINLQSQTADINLTSTAQDVNIISHQQTNLTSQNTQVNITSHQQTNLTSQNGNTQLVSNQNTTIQSQNGQVVVENVTFNSNTISTDGGLDLNIHAQGGDIFTQNTNLDLGTGILTVNSVQHAHVPAGAIIIWYSASNPSTAPTGWAICDGNNGTPDLRGRFIVCSGAGPETTYIPNNIGGQDNYAFTIAEMPPHNHTTLQNITGNTSADHTHAVSAATGNESEAHTHAIGGNTGNATANHSHTLSGSTGEGGILHSHQYGTTGNGSANHAHNTGQSGNHGHPVSVNFQYSASAGGLYGSNHPQLSFLLDDQNFGQINITQTNQGSASVGQGGDHTHTVSESGAAHTHTFHTPNADANHTHTLSGNAAPETTAHGHPLPTITGPDQHNHTHSLQFNTLNQSQTHNHPVTINQTGGGSLHDNRPRWYSLYYIMKL